MDGIRERKNYVLLIIFSLFLALGCSARKTVFHKPLQNTSTQYVVIEIPNFAHSEENWVPYDSVSVIPDMVAERLRIDGNFNEIKRNGEASAENALLLMGKVINYDPGCKFCEWFFGFNDHGKSSVAVRVEFIDKMSGEVIVDVEIEGKAKKPGTGRSRYIRIVDELVSIVKSVNQKG